ncbi:SycD/LcrH family type III secretion system chaperone [Desulfovibrionales bacterium]
MNTTQPPSAETPLTDAEIQTIIQAMHNGASIGDAANIGPEMLEGLYTLGYNLYTTGNFTDAETVFQALCLYKHTEVRFWMGLAGCRQANGNLPGAIDAYSMAGVAAELADPTPFLYAANCYIKLGDKENAMGALEGLLALGDPANPAHAECHAKAKNLLDMLRNQS